MNSTFTYFTLSTTKITTSVFYLITMSKLTCIYLHATQQRKSQPRVALEQNHLLKISRQAFISNIENYLDEPRTDIVRHLVDEGFLKEDDNVEILDESDSDSDAILIEPDNEHIFNDAIVISNDTDLEALKNEDVTRSSLRETDDEGSSPEIYTGCSTPGTDADLEDENYSKNNRFTKHDATEKSDGTLLQSIQMPKALVGIGKAIDIDLEASCVNYTNELERCEVGERTEGARLQQPEESNSLYWLKKSADVDSERPHLQYSDTESIDTITVVAECKKSSHRKFDFERLILDLDLFPREILQVIFSFFNLSDIGVIVGAQNRFRDFLTPFIIERLNKGFTIVGSHPFYFKLLDSSKSKALIYRHSKGYAKLMKFIFKELSPEAINKNNINYYGDSEGYIEAMSYANSKHNQDTCSASGRVNDKTMIVRDGNMLHLSIPNPESLHLLNWNQYVNIKSIHIKAESQYYLTYFEQLEELSIETDWRIDILRVSKSLKHLSLIAPLIHPYAVHELIKIGLNLDFFKIQIMNESTPSGTDIMRYDMNYLINYMSYKRLEVAAQFDTPLFPIRNFVKGLEYLSLVNCSSFNMCFLEVGNASLKHLDICKVGVINVSQIKQLSQLRNLESLRLIISGGVESRHLKGVFSDGNSFRRLKALTIDTLIMNSVISFPSTVKYLTLALAFETNEFFESTPNAYLVNWPFSMEKFNLSVSPHSEKFLTYLNYNLPKSLYYMAISFPSEITPAIPCKRVATDIVNNILRECKEGLKSLEITGPRLPLSEISLEGLKSLESFVIQGLEVDRNEELLTAELNSLILPSLKRFYMYECLIRSDCWMPIPSRVYLSERCIYESLNYIPPSVTVEFIRDEIRSIWLDSEWKLPTEVREILFEEINYGDEIDIQYLREILSNHRVTFLNNWHESNTIDFF